MTDTTMRAQPIRRLGAGFYCLLDGGGPCRHLVILLGLPGITRAALLEALPVVRVEDTLARYRVCRPEDGRAIPLSVETSAGVAPHWMLALVLQRGGVVTYSRIEGSCN